MPEPETEAAPARPAGLEGGSARPVVLYPDPRLRAACEPVAGMDRAGLRALAADMLATMYAAMGRGLAAPQIGVSRRLFVMDAGWKSGLPAPRVLLDPQVLWRSEAVGTVEEQCLSIPGRPVAVSRPAQVIVGWTELDGTSRQQELAGAEARIAQHEIDHLDGVLIVDFAEGARP